MILPQKNRQVKVKETFLKETNVLSRIGCVFPSRWVWFTARVIHTMQRSKRQADYRHSLFPIPRQHAEISMWKPVGRGSPFHFPGWDQEPSCWGKPRPRLALWEFHLELPMPLLGFSFASANISEFRIWGDKFCLDGLLPERGALVASALHHWSEIYAHEGWGGPQTILKGCIFITWGVHASSHMPQCILNS